MTKTKHSLLMSAIALLLCFSMLIGTTFAWFTDTVVSSGNKIQSGTLKVDLELLGTDNTTWTSLKADKKPIFNYLNWEPGYTDVKILKIENEGTLALKWVAQFVSEKALSELANVIDVYVKPSATEFTYPTDRNDLTGWTPAGTVAEFVNTIEQTTKGTLTAMGTEGSVAYLGIALKMQEEADNDYQNLDLGGEFDIVIYATQLTAEKDSFDENYDEGAYLPVVYKAEELKSALEQGESVKLGENMTVNEIITIPTQANVELDLDGKELKANIAIEKDADVVISNGNINTANSDNSAIETVGNLTLDNVTVESERHGVRVEGGETVINGGTYKASGFAGRTQHALNVSDGGKVIINGGKFIGPKGTASDSGSAVKVQKDSTVIINGGDFSGGKNNTLSNSGTLTVKGGTFDQDPSAYLAEGYDVLENADGTYSVVKGTVASTKEDLDDALNTANNGDTVYLTQGTYTFPASNLKEGVTLECAPGTVFEGNSKLNINGATVIGATFSNPTGTAVDQTINGTFKDCTFDGKNGLRWCYAGDTVVFENCIFSGDVYGAHFDDGANEVLFKDCTFSGFNAMGGAITKLTLEGCTFVSNGRSGYNGINMWGNTELINCTFVFDGSVSYEWVDACGDNTTISAKGCVISDGTTERALILDDIGNYGTGNTITVE